MAINIADSFNRTTAQPPFAGVVFADLTARDAYATTLRYEGMECYVVAEGLYYSLVGGIANGDWIEREGGSGSGVVAVADIAARDAILEEDRALGMIVQVQTIADYDGPLSFQLVGGITNADWVIFDDILVFPAMSDLVASSPALHKLGIRAFIINLNLMYVLTFSGWTAEVSQDNEVTLTNKDIDGGTASNTNRITLPKNTKTNLDGLSRKQGTLCYSTTDNKLYFDDGVALFPLASEAASIPAGVVLPYAGSSTPSGYLPCLGQAVSRTTYAALFFAIGTQYGSGDGSTTFNLPNPQALGLRFAGDQTYNTVSYSAYLGEKRNDAIQNITGSIGSTIYQRLSGAKSGAFGNISGATAQDNSGGFNGAVQSGINFDASRVARTDTQTHGADMAFNGIIKY